MFYRFLSPLCSVGDDKKRYTDRLLASRITHWLDMVSLDRKHIYDYHVDDQGNWFCEGNPVADQQLFCMLSRSLYEQGGRYFIRCEGEVHPVRVDDAPIWIRYVHLEKDRLGSLLRVDIELEDGRREPLAAETLTVVNNRALYCLATRRRLKARFGRVAYYELTQHLQTDDQGPSFYLTIDGRRYPIHPEPRIQEPGVRSRNGEYCELVRE